MEFLEDNEIREWATKHGLQVTDGGTLRLPELPCRFENTYADGRRSGREGSAAGELVMLLGSWDECLVRITLWGVWPSSEDWPQFYAWRGVHDERRSLDTAPGHLFTRDEVGSLVQLVTLVMENAWDADVFCSSQGRADRLRAKISHDEWFEILAATPINESAR